MSGKLGVGWSRETLSVVFWDGDTVAAADANLVSGVGEKGLQVWRWDHGVGRFGLGAWEWRHRAGDPAVDKSWM